jgi:acetyl-CoA C-acetyltransferase
MRDLLLDPDRVNVNGGHRAGASDRRHRRHADRHGARRTQRRNLGTGLVTMCTGGGMGTATIIERI